MPQQRRFTVPTGLPRHRVSPTPPQRPLRQIFGSYFSLAIWRSLLQHATYYHYWMRAAAIAYGLSICLVLSFLALVAAVSLFPDLKTVAVALLTQWSPNSVETISNLVAQVTTEWETSYRWLLMLVSSGLVMGLWLGGVGAAQQIIRAPGYPESAAISVRQRLNTLLLALVSALLLALAYGLVFTTLPNEGDAGATHSAAWNLVRHLLTEGLRWSLTISTISLMFGLFYRSSTRSAASSLPMLPGAALATVIWAILSILLKMHVSSLHNYHWLYGVFSTIALLQLGGYFGIVGLLLGGHFNALMKHYFPHRSSRPQTAATPLPPPSFESFTIQRRSDQSR